MRICRRISCPKVLLWLSNVTLMGSASALLVAGGLLYLDQPKLIISKLLGVGNEFLAELPRPLFYYAAVLLALLGLIGLFASILGCWANCWTNYCTLTMYFLSVFILLIGEFVLSISITIWPNCLGLQLDEDVMVRALQSEYGIPGHESFTVAIDLAQTKFSCCGMSSDINYDHSNWLLQSYAKKDLTVPLTCCILAEEDGREAANQYLDPMPSNLTLCQSIQRSDYAKSRHLKSCLEELQSFYTGNYMLFIGIISLMVLVNFFVLLTIIYSCTNLKRSRRRSMDQHMAEFERKVNDRRNILAVASSSTGSSPIPGENGFVQPPQQQMDYDKQRHVTTFRSTGNASNLEDYRGTKAYLV